MSARVCACMHVCVCHFNFIPQRLTLHVPNSHAEVKKKCVFYSKGSDVTNTVDRKISAALTLDHGGKSSVYHLNTRSQGGRFHNTENQATNKSYYTCQDYKRLRLS